MSSSRSGDCIVSDRKSKKASVRSEKQQPQQQVPQQQQQLAADDGEQNTEQVLMLVSFQSQLHRQFCNACVRQASVIKQYGGQLVGHCDLLESIEGYWPKNHGLGVLTFTSLTASKKWLQSDPLFRAADFLDQVEMYVLALNRTFPTDYKYLSIMNLNVQFQEIFLHDYLPKHRAGVSHSNGLACLATGELAFKARGIRCPKFFLIDAWKNREDFENWRRVDVEQQSSRIRQQTASGDFVLATMNRQI